MKSISIWLLMGVVMNHTLPAQNSMEYFKKDIQYLASDELEGRGVGSRGANIACGYIVGILSSLDIEPGYRGAWLQPFEFVPKSAPHAMQQGDSVRLGLGMVRALNCNNVVGFIDNNAENTVLIGAHYDHLGLGDENSLWTGAPQIHNGADDNASGVAGMLSLARWLSQRPEGTRGHNYCFVAFSGEEKGLVGSKKLVESFPFSKSSLAYMLNMDMIGRLNKEKSLAVNGTGTSPIWLNVLDKCNADSLKLIKSESGMGPSDHTSFYLENIPVIHFFTGQHEDYHKPTDDSEKINYEGMEWVVNYMKRIVMACDDVKKPEFTKTIDKSPSASDFKVTLGVMPDYVFDGKGLRIDGCKDDRPALKAGLQRGDVIVRMGDYSVDDIYGYMEALGKFEKGQTIEVTFLRDGISKVVSVSF